MKQNKTKQNRIGRYFKATLFLLAFSLVAESAMAQFKYIKRNKKPPPNQVDTYGCSAEPWPDDVAEDYCFNNTSLENPNECKLEVSQPLIPSGDSQCPDGGYALICVWRYCGMF